MKKLNTYKQFVNENVSDEEVFSYLNDLRDSGQTNMFGAGAYIEKAFNLDKRKAREILAKWMKSFDEGKVNEDRAGITKLLTNLTGDLFGFMKTLDKQLPQKAKSNPDMKKDLVQLMNLKKIMLQSMDNWSEYLIDMDEKYPG
jgi:hypothetical protein